MCRERVYVVANKTCPAVLDGKDQQSFNPADNQFAKNTYDMVPMRRGKAEELQCAGLDTEDKHIAL